MSDYTNDDKTRLDKDLKGISEELRKNQGLLESGLQTCYDYLEGPMSKQHVFVLQDARDIQKPDPTRVTWTVSAWDLMHMYGESAVRYEPKQWDYLPAGWGHPNYQVWEFRKEDHPEGKKAFEEFKRQNPYLTSVGLTQGKDVNDLIEFPATVGVFLQKWKEIVDQVDTIPNAIASVLTFSNDVSWTGPGATSYQNMVGKQKQAAEAIVTGIHDIQEDAWNIVDAALTVCTALKQNAIDTVKTAQEWFNRIATFDPKKWLDWVNGLVTYFTEQMEKSSKAVDEAVKQLSALSKLKMNLGTQMSQLRQMSGATQPGKYISWPPPPMSETDYHNQIEDPWTAQ